MKIRTRIAAAVTAALATLFVATPAFAASEGFAPDPSAAFSTAGTPLDYVAIAIVMVVLLAVVLLGSALVGNLFEKKGR